MSQQAGAGTVQGARDSFEKGFLRYVVPFYIEAPEGESFEVVCAGFRPSEWKPLTDYYVNPDLYDHVAQWLQPRDGRREICRSWKYIPFNAHSNDGMRIDWVREDQSLEPLLITRLGVTLFVTGVGFLWYEVQSWQRNTSKPLSGESLSELLRFSHAFKELGRSARRLVDPAVPMLRLSPDELRLLEAQPGTDGLTVMAESKRLLLNPRELERRLAEISPKAAGMAPGWLAGRAFVLLRDDRPGAKGYLLAAQMPIFGLWIRQLLLSVCDGIRFFAVVNHKWGGQTIQVPDKGVLYAFAVTDLEGRKALRTEACYLAKGYHDEYGVSNLVKQSAMDLFKGCELYISREGCGFVAGAEAEEFHRGMAFRSRFSSIYFWVYLLILQQTYSLLNFSRRVAEVLPSTPKAYLEEDGGALADKMDVLLLEINAFLVRNRFSSVSSIHHINDFYRYGCAQMTISEDITSLYESLRSLTEMQENRVRRLENAREKVADEKIEGTMRRLAVLAIVSALCDSVGMVVAARDEIAALRNHPSPWFVLCVALWVLMWGAVVVVGGPAVKNVFRDVGHRLRLPGKGKKRREKRRRRKGMR